ncbi:MAG: divalent metal cation transporter [Verrucomicrobiales bacterium]|nr:divalent metal cation transporter [Verrucomicrobiales bacterium]
MSKTEDALIKEKELLSSVANKGTGAKLKTYSKLCGPGWLQSAITLGGGSLVGALGVGVIGGLNFMWVQPLAMILGIIMLSAIAYVTLSTGERPFRSINKHISPFLGWAWLGATIVANLVWVLPQFNLAFGAIATNLAPGVFPETTGSKLLISAIVLAIATTIIWSYGAGSKGVARFELLLKILVGLVVISFIGVVIVLTFAANSPLNWANVISGLMPDFGALFRPSETFLPYIDQLDPIDRDKWTADIIGRQRDNIIAAFGTTVGINMTFLLPYSMLRRKWGKEHRGLAIFDLSTGLFIPFVIATGCLVIAAASQFHGNMENNKFENSASLVEQLTEKEKSTLSSEEKSDKLEAIYIAMPSKEKANATLEMMTAKRNQFELANALKPFTGNLFSQYVFGIGVLAMAVSTIVILMLINGFAVCEMLGVPDGGVPHRVGCLIVGGIGFFGPLAWGELGPWLAIPVSVFGMTLLPIAYITFLLMMNSKSLLGDRRPEGSSLLRWNILMIIATTVATLGAGWASYGKIGWWGPGLILIFGILALLTRQKTISNTN